MTDSDLDADLTTKVIDGLNRILELELAGVVKTKYALYRALANRTACVDLPPPSPPSNVMNLPRIRVCLPRRGIR